MDKHPRDTMIEMTDAYEGDESKPSGADESDETGGRGTVASTVVMFALYVVGAGVLIYRQLGGLAASEPQAVGIVLLLLSPLVAFGALGVRQWR